MSSEVQKKTAESQQSLWIITLGPVVWGTHFLVCYGLAAVWCEKFAGPDGSLLPVRCAMAGITVVALAAIGVITWIGWRKFRLAPPDEPTSRDTPEDRHRFLGFATLLLSSLSAVATIYVAMVAIFIPNCS